MQLTKRQRSEREKSLKALGMRDYVDYLASPMWAVIRRRVYARANGICETKGCGAKASAIHHWSYTLRVMRGATLKGLNAVCRDCHKRNHRIGKPSPAKAAKRAERQAFEAWVASGGAIAQKVVTAPRLVKRDKT